MDQVHLPLAPGARVDADSTIRQALVVRALVLAIGTTPISIE